MCVLKQPNWPYHPAHHQSVFNCAVHSCAVGEVSSLSACSFCVYPVMCIFWLCLSILGVSQLQREHLGSVFENVCCVAFPGCIPALKMDTVRISPDQVFYLLEAEDSRKTEQTQLGSANAMKWLLPMSLLCSLTSASQHEIIRQKSSIWFFKMSVLLKSQLWDQRTLVWALSL